MKRLTIRKTVFIYDWYDKDTERFYCAMFTEQGEIAGGYSYSKDEDDPRTFQEICKKVGLENGALMLEKFLREDEKKNRIENLAIPEDCFKAGR